ncbi:MAG: hypothetical protein M1818_003961 [Claussenomyces sp. TS43310]|nr:MAG: hypothetical protein M1818_003961 [Claussenomyces sp. TS43310]
MANQVLRQRTNRKAEIRSDASPAPKAAQAEKKRLSRSDSMVLYPDPFVHHPDPLGCHPFGRQDPEFNAETLRRLRPALRSQYFHPSSPHRLDLGRLHSRNYLLDQVMGGNSRSTDNDGDSVIRAATGQGHIETMQPSAPTRFQKSRSIPLSLFSHSIVALDRAPFSLAKARSTVDVPMALTAYAGENPHRAQGGAGVAIGSAPLLTESLTAASRTDSEAPAATIPSCSGLPMGWDKVHDRFIAYLATHAPLDRRGSPENQAPEFHSNHQIAIMVRLKFPGFRCFKIAEWAIEKRLDILELLDNDYFSRPYHAYEEEEWGYDI